MPPRRSSSQHKDSADQLRQVVRSIVLSEAFRNTYGEKVKRPFDAAASMLRITAADFTPTDEFGWNYDDIGQPLFAHAAPNGYSDFKEAWTGTTSLLQRWQLCNALIEGWVDGTAINLLNQMPGTDAYTQCHRRFLDRPRLGGLDAPGREPHRDGRVHRPRAQSRLRPTCGYDCRAPAAHGGFDPDEPRFSISLVRWSRDCL